MIILKKDKGATMPVGHQVKYTSKDEELKTVKQNKFIIKHTGEAIKTFKEREHEERKKDSRKMRFVEFLAEILF